MSEFFHEYLPGDFRERIKDLLLEHKITQAQLAEKLNISESALNRCLSGQTEKLSADHIVAIARFFKVSTDFLLGLTDIPFVTNFDIEKLGLSVGAAKKLLQRTVDPALVSQLIETPAFDTLIVQLNAARHGTFDAGYNYMSSVFETANQMLTDQVRANPGDRHAAKKVIEEIRTLSVDSKQIELSGLEAAMQQIVAEFKKGSREYLEKMKTLTSEIMRNIASTLRTQMNNPMKLQGVTPEMMVDAVMANLADAELTDEQRDALRAAMLPLFTRPQDLAAKIGDQPKRGLPSGTKP